VTACGEQAGIVTVICRSQPYSSFALLVRRSGRAEITCLSWKSAESKRRRRKLSGADGTGRPSSVKDVHGYVQVS